MEVEKVQLDLQVDVDEGGAGGGEGEVEEEVDLEEIEKVVEMIRSRWYRQRWRKSWKR